MVQRQVVVSPDKCLTKKFGDFLVRSKLTRSRNFILIPSRTFFMFTLVLIEFQKQELFFLLIFWFWNSKSIKYYDFGLGLSL